MLIKMLLSRKIIGVFLAGAMCGFLVGAMHTDHTFTQSVSELVRLGSAINEELEELDVLEELEDLE